MPAKIDFITRCWLGKLFAVWKRVARVIDKNPWPMTLRSTRAPKIGVILSLFARTIQCFNLQISWKSTFALKGKRCWSQLLGGKDRHLKKDFVFVMWCLSYDIIYCIKYWKGSRGCGHRKLVTVNNDIHYKSIRLLRRLLVVPRIRPVDKFWYSPGLGFLQASTAK